ncbi:response regulator [Solidesulfovibrio sp.]|uniref:response regulator n=1 Tax=Solidesulfovibrio sp. TaxID=2910990 RepID=UPI000ED48AD1|nr:response regulator [Solidesulfovibrio sp.]MEA5087389.1 response regulator [Solidesulfovibrio sp.]NMC49217.1 response regulator [Desulfovibrio sp.]HCR12020.1 response regulator [Desulfovibrio sp.]HML59730.1 response regulator [Solidesulfovibrio sp.]
MTGRTPIILVVDDEETIRDSLQLFLEVKGWNVVTAASAEQALEVLARTRCDAAIVDIRLPGQSGDAMILAARPRYPDMKWLICTGSMEFAPGPELAAAGVTSRDVFTKPVADMGLLVDRLRQLLE